MNLTPSTTTTFNFASNLTTLEVQDSENLEFSLARIVKRMVKLDEYYNPQPTKHKASTVPEDSEGDQAIPVAPEEEESPANINSCPVAPTPP